MTRLSAEQYVTELIDNGFDGARVSPRDGQDGDTEEKGMDEATRDWGVHLRCSVCDAAYINGCPCHERGCPNGRAARHRYDLDRDDDE